MKETTDTSQGNDAPLFPKGSYEWTISQPVAKEKTPNGKLYYKFKLTTVLAGRMKKFTHVTMVWMAAPLLRAIGCTEVKPGVFEWDRDLVQGKQFEADVIHEPDFKDKNKMRASLANIRPMRDGSETDEPMPEPPSDLAPEDDIAF